MAVDFTTTIGKVRALTGDVDETNFHMSNAEIDCLILLEPDSLLLVAAQACESMAMKVTMDLGKIKTLDFQSDAPAMAKVFMERAKILRDQHQLALDIGESDVEFIEIEHHPVFSWVLDWPTSV